MKFLSEHTSIPVPKVYCSFVRKNRAYIVMERIQGEDIPTAWRSLSENTRQKIFNDLRDMIQELRALSPKSNRVESCTGGSLRDSRIPRSRPRFDPFESIDEFHLWLRDYLQPSEHSSQGDEQEWEEIKKMAVLQDYGSWPPPVFTHGDLNPSNILVRGERIVGIIDWEFAGWYPNYWEYTSAWLGNITRTEWRDRVCNTLDQFPAELEMEKVRHRWWGGF